MGKNGLLIHSTISWNTRWMNYALVVQEYADQPEVWIATAAVLSPTMLGTSANHNGEPALVPSGSVINHQPTYLPTKQASKQHTNQATNHFSCRFLTRKLWIKTWNLDSSWIGYLRYHGTHVLQRSNHSWRYKPVDQPAIYNVHHTEIADNCGSHKLHGKIW